MCFFLPRRPGQPRQQRGEYTGAALADARKAKERTHPELLRGDDVSSWQWRWGGEGAGKLRPSSGHWPMLVAEPCQHHCDKQQRKHTSLAGRGCSQTRPKRPSPAVSSSKTLLCPPLWMGTPPSSAIYWSSLPPPLWPPGSA